MIKLLLSLILASLSAEASAAQMRAVLPGVAAMALRPAFIPTGSVLSAGLPAIPSAMASLPSVPAAMPAAVPVVAAVRVVSVAAEAVPVAAASAEVPALARLEGAALAGGAASHDAFQAGIQQFDGAPASYRQPTYGEQSKIDESLRRGSELSPIARDLIQDFRDKNGRFVIDPDEQAAYHGTAFRGAQNRPTVALTADTINNGSWAFILATVGRELMNFNDWYKSVPASAEKLAVQYSHMALIFAEATNGSAHAWSTNLDHNHRNEGTYFVWAWYEKLLQAMTSTTVGFIDSEFFVWLRDFVAKQTAENPAYRYSLYERLTGTHYRPDSSLHGTPIPSSVPRLTQAQHDAASARVYGADGNGDNGANTSLIGYLRGWFGGRGNK